ncbi:MAG: hypothetical protein ACLUD7_04205 [Lachnospiraceae bacterium]
MLNNKGFAVSSVLYTLLIAFLLFLGAALAQFSASSSLIGKANDDLVNGSSFEAMQIKPNGACKDGNEWYQDSDGKTSNTIVRIKTRYGTKYWPKDFETSEHKQAKLSDDGNIEEGDYTSYDGKIKTIVTSTENVSGANEESIFYLRIIETEDVTKKEATYPISNEVAEYGMGIFNICNN